MATQFSGSQIRGAAVNVLDYMTKAQRDDVTSGTGSVDILTPINNAIAALPTRGGTIIFPQNGVGACSDKITIPDTQDNITFFCPGRFFTINFTSATSDGIYFTGEHDNFSLIGIKLNSSGSSTGIAFHSPNTGSATPLRDLLLRDFEISGFENGINIAGGLNINLEWGRISGQGKNVSGGVGSDFGSATEAINHIHCRGVYWSSYETNINNRFTSSLRLTDCLSGFCVTALTTGSGRITYLDNMYFDSYADVAIDNNGYLIGSWLASSLGSQRIINGSGARFKRTGNELTNVRVYRASTNQASIATATPTKIQFNAETSDTEGQFNATSTVDAIYSASVNTAGMGYAVGDVLTVSGGTSGTVTVQSVTDAGAVREITVSAAGSGYSAGSNVSTSGGSGSSCTIDTVVAKSYAFTATYPGYYNIHLSTQFRAGTADKTYKAMIYKNGSSIATALDNGPSTVVQQKGMSCSADSIYLDAGDYIEGYVEHDEGVNSEIYFGAANTYMTITDA